MNKKFLLIAAVLAGFAVFGAVAQESSETQAASQTTQVAQAEAPAEKADSAAFKYIAAGLAVGIACIAGGMAVGKIGAAAMGAMSENAELSGKALPFVGLAEGICLWGFLVALLIIIL